MRNNNNAAAAAVSTSTRLLWFGLGVISSLLYSSQLRLQQTASIPQAPAILLGETQGMTEREDEELSKILEEIEDVRRDLQRMTASRDLIKEHLEQCQAKCPVVVVAAKESR